MRTHAARAHMRKRAHQAKRTRGGTRVQGGIGQRKKPNFAAAARSLLAACPGLPRAGDCRATVQDPVIDILVSTFSANCRGYCCDRRGSATFGLTTGGKCIAYLAAGL